MSYYFHRSQCFRKSQTFVIPELKEWKGSDGAFVPTEATKIVYAANNPELERIARIFAQDYQTMFGRSLEVVQGKGAAGDFIFPSAPTRN